MNRLLPTFILGLLVSATGICFFFSPFGQKLEENLGLYLLFKLRGTRPPPQEVVIVNLDNESSARLGLPENISRWPRSIHSRLIRMLNSSGAAIIAFDVHFSEPKNRDEDLAFADAIKEAGNVILFEGLQRETLDAGQIAGAPGEIVKENLIPPIAHLAEAALGVAPFPLPKLPVRINQIWTFKTSAGEIPTLPVAALQARELEHYELFHLLIREKIPGITEFLPPTLDEALASQGLIRIISHLRRLFQRETWLAEYLLTRLAGETSSAISPEEKRGLTTLVRMYEGGNSRYLNYYGPPRTLTTFSCHELLSLAGDTGTRIENALKNKVVFIGAARKSWSGQKDGFYTVFSRPDGLDLSGVELAATAYANLQEDMPLRPLASEPSIALLFCCAIGAAGASFFLPPFYAAALILTISAGMLMSAGYFFAVMGTWMPVVTPFFLQPVIAFFAALHWKFLRAHREKENISRALGFYLPEKVVKELSRDPGFIKTGDQMVYSVCLQTDAQHYTTLSEKTEPRNLGDLMREYYHHIFEPVKKNGGVVSDVVGDAMLALWPSTKPRKDFRINACKAALGILEAADNFNRKHHAAALPTRIGLHYGYMLLGNIGAGNHYEYTPVGDIVNTTSRIEKLNKHLDTKVLASAEAVQELPQITTRELGTFLLSGKSEPIVIHELIAVTENIDIAQQGLCDFFRQGLSAYREKNWTAAIQRFTRCLEIRKNDGPSRFYLHICKSYQNNPPPEGWQGIVQIHTK